jgi:SAM-dependent methyltransferase
MTETRLYPRFPAASFISQAEFAQYCRDVQPRLDMRYLHESGLATADSVLVQAGTCAPCLRRAVFTSQTGRWEQLADRRRIPQWDDALVCDCEDQLPSRARALVHFAQSVAGLRPWTDLLLFGPPAATDRRLAALAASCVSVASLVADEASDRYRLPADDAAFQLVVSAETLHRVPPLAAALREFRRVLAPGGSLALMVPFRYRAARTSSRTDVPLTDGRRPALYREPVHEIGWDVLDMLRAAGFSHAAAYSYWSNELGYLGSFNTILHAVH